MFIQPIKFKSLLTLIVLLLGTINLSAQREKNYIYLFDCTWSMKKNGLWDPAQSALDSNIALRASIPGSHFTVIPFGDNPYDVFSFDNGNYAANKQDIGNAFDKYINQAKFTNISDVLKSGFQNVDSKKDNEIYLFTDGMPNNTDSPSRVAQTTGTWVNLILDEEGKTSPKTIWEFLLTYVRSQTYPNGTAGAFLDTMSVVHNFTKGRNEMKDQKCTTTGRLILEVSKPTYNQLTECLAQSSNFTKAADKGYKGFWKIAPMYFILLDKLSMASEDGIYIGNTPLNEFVASVRTHYDEDILKPALFLAGVTLGQSSTYKMLYAIKKGELPFLM